MKTFLIIWFGQVISLLGSKLTEFALGVWVYQQTGSISQFSLILLLNYLPNILISPIAGALVDRWNRRWAMIISDSVAGMTTLTLMVLVLGGRLEVWNIYIAFAIISFFNAFQVPAYTAGIAQLVPEERRSRANGMVQVSKAIAKIVSPILGGFLVTIIQLQGVLIIDFSTFLFATATLLLVHFPPLEQVKKRVRTTYRQQIAQLWQEIVSGWQYISERTGLLMLLSFMAVSYFSMGVLEVTFWPFVLNVGDSQELGIVLSLGGCGMLVGGLLMSVWDGPKRKIYGVLSFVPLQGFFILLGCWRASVYSAAIGIVGYLFAQPIIISCNQTIWQNKVPLKLQGRVFALQQMLERSLSILAYAIAGPLVDFVLDPLMKSEGKLANTLRLITGTGIAQDIILVLILVGLLNIVAGAIAYREPQLRHIEDRLPDVKKSSRQLSSVR